MMIVFLCVVCGELRNLTSFLIDISHSLVSLFWSVTEGSLRMFPRCVTAQTLLTFNKFIPIKAALTEAITECGPVLRLPMTKEEVINS